jgi:hypothetical protein
MVGMTFIDQGRGVWLTAVVTVVMMLAAPSELATAQAEDAAGVKPQDAPPAEDPAEVQRRQQIKQQAAHAEQQITKLLYGDLELMRAICGDLPRETRRAIAAAGEQAVKKAALRLTELQFDAPGRQPRRRGGGVAGAVIDAVINGIDPGGNPPAVRQPDDPLGAVSAALAKSLADHGGSEQAAVFSAQVSARNERRRLTLVRGVVAALDGELCLTASQREKIEESLREDWNDSIAVSLQGVRMVDGRRVFPGVPDACVRPHLTESQRQRFVPQPQQEETAAGQRQAWMQTLNLLGNVHAASRDPWWFE